MCFLLELLGLVSQIRIKPSPGPHMILNGDFPGLDEALPKEPAIKTDSLFYTLLINNFRIIDVLLNMLLHSYKCNDMIF